MEREEASLTTSNLVDMKDFTEKDLRDMKLHEEIYFKGEDLSAYVVRVIGGWIYWFEDIRPAEPIFIPETAQEKTNQ